ncbi:MAG: pitrilysin family protein [Neisseria sp.]|nr:pitrilysin family protein [Neisseria sp.]
MNKRVRAVILGFGLIFGFSFAKAAGFQTASAISIDTWKNADGSTVSLVSRHELPIVNIQVSFKQAGTAADSKTDVASFTASLLATGTQQLDEEKLREEANRLGITIASKAGTDFAGVNLLSLSREDTLQPALVLMNQVITQPSFDEKVLQRNQAQAVSALKQQESSPAFLGGRAMAKLNYEDHPYANASETSAATLSAVTRWDLQDFHRRRYAKDNAYIAIVGDVTKPQAQAISKQLLDGLPEHAEPQPAVPPVPSRKGRSERITFEGKEQTVVLMGLPFMTQKDPDRHALAVGNYILGGGGFDSRLMKTLRDEKGLVYGVSSSLSQNEQKAPFDISFSTKKDEAATALAAAHKVLADFIANGPTEAELQQAKDYLTGSFPLRFDTNAKLLPYVVRAGIYQRDADYLNRYNAEIMKVTAEQVRETWQRRLKLDELNVVVVGGTEKLSAAKKAGKKAAKQKKQ